MEGDGIFPVETYTFDVIGRMRGADRSAILNELSGLMSMFGFGAMILAGIPNPEDPLKPMVLAERWPREWSSRYHANNYGPRDSVLQHTHRSVDPFRWSTTRDELGLGKNIVLDEASEFGMSEGLVVPFRGSRGLKSALSLGTDKYMLTPRDENAIHLIALYAFQALTPPPPESDLTSRERECVRWLAAGKSAWETAVITGIHELTVKDHLRHARSKTGTVTGAQLVAECIRMGWV